MSKIVANYNYDWATKKNLKRLKFTWWLIWIYAFLFYFLTMETVVDRKKLVLHVRLY